MSELNQLREASGGHSSPPDEAVLDYENIAAPSRRMEIAISIIALTISIAAWVLSQNIRLRMGGGGIDPKWWPTVLSIVGCILSSVMLLTAILRPPADRSDLEGAQSDGWPRVAASLALTGLYIFGWAQLGYVVPTAVYLLALLWLYGIRSWKPLVLFPVITTAFIYGLFHILLRIPL